MKPQRQRVVDSKRGDCFAACMASLLELPLDIVPNDHSPEYWLVWRAWLKQFGLEMRYGTAQGPIWAIHPWIASVRSKNYPDGTTHAIIMHNGGEVLFDPSTKKRYKKGERLLGGDIVVGGYIIEVADFSKLHMLQRYREKLSQ